ncbi:MAG: hypothetical protein ACKOBG_03970 [Actinomycetota bacterium]
MTAAMLRRADDMCPRRLHHHHSGARATSAPGGDAFAVSNRIASDAELWHRAGADGAAFPEPGDLEPEQRAVYTAAGRTYLRRFGGVPVRVDDLGWSSDLADPEVRLLGRVGLAVVLPDGRPELRILRTTGDAGPRSLVDDVDLRFALLRTADWAPDGVRVAVVDLVADRSIEYDLDGAARVDAREWLAARLDVVRARADRSRPVVGRDCGSCPCIPGCAALTEPPAPR